MGSTRLHTLLLLLVSAVSVLAALGSNVAFTTIDPTLKDPKFGGGYWFQEVAKSSATTIADKDLQAAAENGWKTAKSKAPNVKSPPDYPNGVKAPPIMVALFVPGQGTIIASSIKVGAAEQSSQTCTTVTWKHRNYANCAEPNSVSIEGQLGWGAIPKGSKMAIYGKPGKTEGFQNPCADGTEKGDGCQRFLRDNPNIELVNPKLKRAVAVEFAA